MSVSSDQHGHGDYSPAELTVIERAERLVRLAPRHAQSALDPLAAACTHEEWVKSTAQHPEIADHEWIPGVWPYVLLRNLVDEHVLAERSEPARGDVAAAWRVVVLLWILTRPTVDPLVVLGEAAPWKEPDGTWGRAGVLKNDVWREPSNRKRCFDRLSEAVAELEAIVTAAQPAMNQPPSLDPATALVRRFGRIRQLFASHRPGARAAIQRAIRFNTEEGTWAEETRERVEMLELYRSMNFPRAAIRKQYLREFRFTRRQFKQNETAARHRPWQQWLRYTKQALWREPTGDPDAAYDFLLVYWLCFDAAAHPEHIGLGHLAVWQGKGNTGRYVWRHKDMEDDDKRPALDARVDASLDLVEQEIDPVLQNLATRHSTAVLDQLPAASDFVVTTDLRATSDKLWQTLDQFRRMLLDGKARFVAIWQDTLWDIRSKCDALGLKRSSKLPVLASLNQAIAIDPGGHWEDEGDSSFKFVLYSEGENGWIQLHDLRDGFQETRVVALRWVESWMSARERQLCLPIHDPEQIVQILKQLVVSPSNPTPPSESNGVVTTSGGTASPSPSTPRPPRKPPRSSDIEHAKTVVNQYNAALSRANARGATNLTDNALWREYRSLPKDEKRGKDFTEEYWLKLLGIARRTDVGLLPAKRKNVRNPDPSIPSKSQKKMMAIFARCGGFGHARKCSETQVD